MKHSIRALAVFLLAIMTISCSRDFELPKNYLSETSPYTMHPLAQQVNVKKIEADAKGNNLVVEAVVSRKNYSSKYLLVVSDKDTVVYRNDGKGDDEVAGDEIYTTRIKADLDDLSQYFVRRRDNRRDSVSEFKHRQIIRRAALTTPGEDEAKRFGAGTKATITTADPFDPNLRDHSLMITDISVIEDLSRTRFINNSEFWVGTPNGVWTFGYLMRQMANQQATGVSPEDFTMAWLDTWKTDQTINQVTAPRRLRISQIISNWPKSGGKIDLDQAPFKLVAIVNRVDLKGKPGYGGAIPGAGEGRFVFNVVDQQGTTHSSTSFNVIFEFGFNFATEASLKVYQTKWASLSRKTMGSVDYNNTLEELTREFTDAGRNPAKPNGSCINQIRTNEIFMGGPWELREFKLDAATHKLLVAAPRNEPQLKYNVKTDNPDVRQLVAWVNANSGVISSGVVDLPQPFSTASAINNGGVFWDGVANPPSPSFINDSEARFQLSFNTCTGCHGRETGSGFTQIDQSGNLSLFLSGNGVGNVFTVIDPIRRNANGTPIVRKFNDLDNRAQILNLFAPLPLSISSLLIEPTVQEH